MNNLDEKREASIIREFTIQDHLEGNQPFATEYLERQVDIERGFPPCRHCDETGFCTCRACTLGRVTEAAPCSMCADPDVRRAFLSTTKPVECRECHGTGECHCLACHNLNGGKCLFCSPSAKVLEWRNLPSYRERLGPSPKKGDSVNTPTDRFIEFFPH